MQQKSHERLRRILLADDDEVSREIVSYILSSLPDIELVMVSDGKAALEAAMERPFDLMIFDQNMPHISGGRVIRQLKAAQTINATTPIIQFTADVDSLITGSVVLADDILPKPVRAEALLSAINRLSGIRTPLCD
jgi:two-component system, chemotaxis family, chemotaxis protein CheY